MCIAPVKAGLLLGYNRAEVQGVGTLILSHNGTIKTMVRELPLYGECLLLIQSGPAKSAIPVMADAI